MRNHTGDMFGKEKLKSLIRENHSLSAHEQLDLIDDGSWKFRGEKEPEDDVTMVVILTFQ